MTEPISPSLSVALWLLMVQGLLGAWDTLYFHEYVLRLPVQPGARQELTLHARRDFAYAVLFGSLGWASWNGLLAGALAVILGIEIVLTLNDFLEEDRTRRLPPGERVMHAIMGIIYGMFLAFLLPNLVEWAHRPIGFGPLESGWFRWILSAMGAGVVISGVRDLVSARRGNEWPRFWTK